MIVYRTVIFVSLAWLSIGRVKSLQKSVKSAIFCLFRVNPACSLYYLFVLLKELLVLIIFSPFSNKLPTGEAIKSFLNVYLLRSERYTRPSLHEPIRTRLRGVNDASSHLPFPSWCREVAPRIDTPLQD